jgi:hypothetical protein
MRWYLRLTTLVASLLVTAWAFPGCSSDEGTEGKTDSGAISTGKMDDAMDKGKMGGGAMETGKMDGGAMEKGKMNGTSK